MKQFLRDYFYFNKSERNGLVVLVLLSIIILFLPDLVPQNQTRQYHFEAFESQINKWLEENNKMAKENTISDSFLNTASSSVNFKFDPNTLPKDSFLLLGLPIHTVNTIIKYREKGGRFWKKQDFKKIYTLNASDYNRLENSISINPAIKKKKKMEAREKYQKKLEPNSRKWKPSKELSDSNRQTVVGKRNADSKLFKTEPKKIISVLDINQATSEEWDQLPGIGPYYAKRIVNFREKLGGFYSVDQIAETYHLPDSTFRKIKNYLNPSPVTRKLKLNELSVEELKDHPYINWKQAKLIVNYRKQHGNFSSPEQIRKIKAFSSGYLEKLLPYLSIE